ncbi:MAG: hypothetical protein WBD37_12610 [Anderseniella sp.]
MKTLLMILAIVLIAAGVAVGLINVFSPGTVTVGLNFDVAATLFTGGCVLLGLGLVAGNLAELLLQRHSTSAQPATPLAGSRSKNDDLPDFMSPAGGVIAGAGAVAAATAATADNITDNAGYAVDDVLDTVSDAAQDEAASLGTAFGSIDETVSDTVSDKVDEIGDDLSSLFDKAPDADNVTDMVEEAASDAVTSAQDFGAEAIETITDNAEAATEVAAEAADDVAEEAEAVVEDIASTVADEEVVLTSDEPVEAMPDEDALFVVEERTIRERPARLLSDGTVEAETDEGWMRFENVEHVEEYLDAMKATA